MDSRPAGALRVEPPPPLEDGLDPEDDAADDIEIGDEIAGGASAGPTPPSELPALDWLYQKYGRYVAAIALRLLGRDTEVDDVVQDVFLATVERIGTLRNPDAIKRWLAVLTTRFVAKRLRWSRLRLWLGAQDHDPIDDIVSSDASPETRALVERVYGVLNRMPTKARIAWTLRYVSGERLEEVAAICGCSLATAKRRIAVVQEAMQREIGDE